MMMVRAKIGAEFLKKFQLNFQKISFFSPTLPPMRRRRLRTRRQACSHCRFPVEHWRDCPSWSGEWTRQKIFLTLGFLEKCKVELFKNLWQFRVIPPKGLAREYCVLINSLKYQTSPILFKNLFNKMLWKPQNFNIFFKQKQHFWGCSPPHRQSYASFPSVPRLRRHRISVRGGPCTGGRYPRQKKRIWICM